MSGHDSVKRNVLSRVRKVAGDGADVTSSGRQFHTWGPATEYVRLPTVERSKPEAKQGSHCRKSEVLGDLEGRQRRQMGKGTTVLAKWHCANRLGALTSSVCCSSRGAAGSRADPHVAICGADQRNRPSQSCLSPIGRRRYPRRIKLRKLCWTLDQIQRLGLQRTRIHILLHILCGDFYQGKVTITTETQRDWASMKRRFTQHRLHTVTEAPLAHFMVDWLIDWSLTALSAQ